MAEKILSKLRPTRYRILHEKEHHMKINQLRVNTTQILIESEGRLEVYSKSDLKFIRTLFVSQYLSTIPFTVSESYVVAQSGFRTLSVFDNEIGNEVGVCKCDEGVHMFAVDHDEVYMLADEGAHASSSISIYSIPNKTMTRHGAFPYSSHFAVKAGIVCLLSSPSILLYSREGFKSLNSIHYPEGAGVRRWLTSDTISILHRRKKKKTNENKTENETKNRLVVLSHQGEELFTWYVPISSRDKLHCWNDELYFASKTKLYVSRLA